jgi:hypothetical protein
MKKREPSVESFEKFLMEFARGSKDASDELDAIERDSKILFALSSLTAIFGLLSLVAILFL